MSDTLESMQHLSCLSADLLCSLPPLYAMAHMPLRTKEVRRKLASHASRAITTQFLLSLCYFLLSQCHFRLD